MRIMYEMIGIICFPCSTVIVDMLNIFIKNNNYFKAKVNNILRIIYKNDLIHGWRCRLLNRQFRFRKMEMEVL